MGERGTDLDLLKIHGPPKRITAGHSFPFIVVAPQFSLQYQLEHAPERLNFIDTVLRQVNNRHAVDENRIYVTGLSMGGFLTWQIAAEFPHRFAALVPICGGGDPQIASRIQHLPVWVFHGAADQIVPLKESQAMVESLRRLGNNVRFTIYPDVAHDSWTETYANPELYTWLLKQVRSAN